MLIWQTLALLLVAYLPGALAFRLPVGRREQRGSLAAEERVFWGIVLSVSLSSVVALTLASAGQYQFNRLLWINGGFCVILLLLFRGRIGLGAVAPPPTRAAVLPVGLAAVGLSLTFFVPPAEYIIGGKGPGIYMNEGIQIAQRGALIIADEVARSVPPPPRIETSSSPLRRSSSGTPITTAVGSWVSSCSIPIQARQSGSFRISIPPGLPSRMVSTG